jgi:hypothetical protein
MTSDALMFFKKEHKKCPVAERETAPSTVKGFSVLGRLARPTLLPRGYTVLYIHYYYYYYYYYY